MKTALAVLGGLVAGLAMAGGAFVALSDDGSDGDDTPAAGDKERPSPPPVATDQTAAALGPATRGGEVIVFLDLDVSDEERRGVEEALDADPEVVAYEYWDQEESLAEARRLFQNNGKMLATINESPEIIPASYRLDVAGTDVESAGRVALDLEELPGVDRTTVAPSADDWAGTG
jgi:FtsX extracellular domain